MRMQEYEFWFVVGSQFLYGPEVLETVARRAAEMADLLNASGNLPCRMVYKVTAKTNQEIADVVREANYDPRCAGIITWCHTFSPSKMWINGFVNLQKPYCHFATQYNREIPNEEIDMDFMNLNQAAHATGSTGSWRPGCGCRARSSPGTGRMRKSRSVWAAGCAPPSAWRSPAS